MKALIIDEVYEGIGRELGKYMAVEVKLLPTQEELAEMIGDYDVLIMRVDPAIDKRILDAAKNLKVIGVCSVGLNHIDMDTAKEKGIQVFNAPGMNGNAVAELTLAKMLELSRHTIPADYDVTTNKHWDKYRFVGRELRGKTLGILGFGRIGQRVGELGRAFLGFGDQVVGGVPLGGQHRHHAVALAVGLRNDAGHIADTVGVGNGAAAEFLYDK